MRSGGQSWALEQLEQIASEASGALEIVEVTEPPEEGGDLKLSVSVDCSGYPYVEGGIQYRQRERLAVSIPRHFPLEIPTLHFTHTDYKDFAHVQWGTSICLYQAPESEWQPDDGMFGFVQRMDDWLRAGAANQLDPVGLPLHPPVAYVLGQTPAIVPTENTPTAESPWWAGYSKIIEESSSRLELGEWIELEGSNLPLEMRVAPAILLPGDMPFEYPTTIAALRDVLAQRGISLKIIQILLTIGALRSPGDKPLIFVLGAAMRGISGGERRQHLAAWCIKAEHTQELRTAALAATEDNPLDEQLFEEWTKHAPIDWCPVFEERPEIVVQRDTGTPAEYWRGRHVAILGCGAIGSFIAMLLARAGVKKLQLYDKQLVKPGLLTRQVFDRYQIGYGKARATRVNVLAINPKLDVVPSQENVLSVLRDPAKATELFAAEVIIDATASNRLACALEQYARDWPKSHPPIVSMAVGHKADTALMTMAQADVAGAGHDLDRRLKLEFSNSANGRHFLDEFWPASGEGRPLFQPEPGCSDPTFVGSAADLAGLASRMLNVASGWLASGVSDHAFGFGTYMPALPRTVAGRPLEAAYCWPTDGIYADPRHGYQIRLSPASQASMLNWMRKSERSRGANVETGGVLFGQIDDFLKIIWVTAASGPPADSIASPTGFVCGTRGVAAMNREFATRSRGSVAFVGMWHTHPGSTPNPSTIDRDAMEKLFASPDFGGRHFLMMIVGGLIKSPLVAGSLFGRDE